MTGLLDRGVGTEASRHVPQCSHAFASAIEPKQADDIRIAAQEILAQIGASYLTLTSGPAQTPIMRFFDCQWYPVASPEMEFDSIAEWLIDELGIILNSLAKAWPPYALAQPLGIFSDGSGIAFSPDLPNPNGLDWAGRLLTCGARVIEILEFQPNSNWALLSSPSESCILH